MNQEVKHCLKCEASFESKIKTKLYCSESCRKSAESARLRHKRKRITKYCLECGESYRTTHKDQKYCSKVCAHRNLQGMQPNPHKDEIAVYRKWGRLTKRLSRQISTRNKRLKREARTEMHKECGECSSPFSTYRSTQVYCSKPCADKSHKRVGRVKRRAAERGAKIECVNPSKVFDRDGWKCQMCGISTPKKLRGTYKDNAPELDHIIPISKGGEHSYLNTQCSCRKCNHSKADSVIGQLLLVA